MPEFFSNTTERLIFIDTHAHYSDEAFAQDAPAVIARAQEAGVSMMLQPDIDSRERPAMLELCSRYPGVLRPMLGLYPGSVTENWEQEIEDMMARYSPSVVAIGEIGLDYHYSKDSAELQKAALKAQLEIAADWDLPVNIHLRDATEDFLGVLSRCRHLNLRGNIHAYSGSYETFLRLQHYGDWSVGIGGIVTFKKSKLPQVVARIPLEKIVLETDAPYMAPTPLRGRRNESANIPLIAAKVAEIRGLSIEEIAFSTTANAEKLFNLYG